MEGVMKLKNHTDIPTDFIKEVIRFVRPSGISKFDVRISNHGGSKARGVAYSKGSGYHSTVDPIVIVSVAPASRFKRYITWEHGGYLPIPIGSREEAIVVIIAHELRHLWQAKVKMGHRVWGARGQFSERDADAYALHKLREWRRR
jgi:hypothetical protein